MASAAIQSTMTKEAFHSTQSYLALTTRQRAWVDTFIDSQDAAMATKTAYGDNRDESYRAMLTRKVETSSKVIAALDVFYQRSEKDRFVRDLRLNIQNSTGIARVESQKLLAKVLGLVSSDVEQPVCKVGDIVLQNGQNIV
jgi:hypothetical protein